METYDPVYWQGYADALASRVASTTNRIAEVRNDIVRRCGLTFVEADEAARKHCVRRPL